MGVFVYFYAPQDTAFFDVFSAHYIVAAKKKRDVSLTPRK